jgi:hypothetical protein
MSHQRRKGRFTGVWARRVHNASRIAAVTPVARGVCLTIAMMALLLASPTLANARVFSMSVSPNHAAIGVRTCFHFQLMGQDGNPVRGAEVVLEGKAASSNRQGRARICIRLEWAGRHFALALKRHYRVSRAMIKAHSHGLQSGAGNWIYVQYYLAAYDSEGNCNDFIFGDGRYGGCDGNVTATNDVFGPTPGNSDWKPRNGTILLHFYTRVTKAANYGFSDFLGFAPSESSDQYYIEQAYIDSNTGFPGRGDCPESSTVGCLVSGTDPTKTGQPGGPLHLSVQYHHPFLSIPGYSFDMRGYVRSRCPCS